MAGREACGARIAGDVREPERVGFDDEFPEEPEALGSVVDPRDLDALASMFRQVIDAGPARTES